MKKYFSFILTLVCILSFFGCSSGRPEFKDFAAYEDDFSQVRAFLTDYNRNHGETLHIVDINSEFLSVDGNKISDSSLSAAVRRLYAKDFSYIEINSDCIIFWDDETGYYGVLWSENPKKAIIRYQICSKKAKAEALNQTYRFLIFPVLCCGWT